MKNRNFFILQILPTFLVEKKLDRNKKKKKKPTAPPKSFKWSFHNINNLLVYVVVGPLHGKIVYFL